MDNEASVSSGWGRELVSAVGPTGVGSQADVLAVGLAHHPESSRNCLKERSSTVDVACGGVVVAAAAALVPWRHPCHLQEDWL